MDRLYRASDLSEAHLLRDLLEEDGLSCCIVNENLASLAGDTAFRAEFLIAKRAAKTRC